MRAGETEIGRAVFGQAADLARAAGDGDALARAALGRSGLGVVIRAVDRPQVALLEEALAATADEALRASLLARLAIETYYDGDPARRIALADEAVAIARRLGDPAALAAALGAQRVALWDADHLAQRRAISEELVAVAVAAGDGLAELQGRNWLVVDLIDAGERRAGRGRDRALRGPRRTPPDPGAPVVSAGMAGGVRRRRRRPRPPATRCGPSWRVPRSRRRSEHRSRAAGAGGRAVDGRRAAGVRGGGSRLRLRGGRAAARGPGVALRAGADRGDPRQPGGGGGAPGAGGPPVRARPRRQLAARDLGAGRRGDAPRRHRPGARGRETCWPRSPARRSRRSAPRASTARPPRCWPAWTRSSLANDTGSDPKTAEIGVRPQNVSDTEGARIARYGTKRSDLFASARSDSLTSVRHSPG